MSGATRDCAVWVSGSASASEPAGGLLLLLNAGDSEQPFVVPAPPPSGPWMCHFDTARENTELQSLKAAVPYPLAASSAVLLES